MQTILVLSLLHCLYVNAHLIQPRCKTSPGSPFWPSRARWETLNKTLDGRLLNPVPQAAVCHPDKNAYDPAVCKSTNWTEAATYVNDPLGLVNPNWSDDSCLPLPSLPCSGEGFPVYVINATSAAHVAAGVNFARSHNIRLNVKGEILVYCAKGCTD